MDDLPKVLDLEPVLDVDRQQHLPVAVYGPGAGGEFSIALFSVHRDATSIAAGSGMWLRGIAFQDRPEIASSLANLAMTEKERAF